MSCWYCMKASQFFKQGLDFPMHLLVRFTRPSYHFSIMAFHFHAGCFVQLESLMLAIIVRHANLKKMMQVAAYSHPSWLSLTTSSWVRNGATVAGISHQLESEQGLYLGILEPSNNPLCGTSRRLIILLAVSQTLVGKTMGLPALRGDLTRSNPRYKLIRDQVTAEASKQQSEEISPRLQKLILTAVSAFKDGLPPNKASADTKSRPCPGPNVTKDELDGSSSIDITLHWDSSFKPEELVAKKDELECEAFIRGKNHV